MTFADCFLRLFFNPLALALAYTSDIALGATYYHVAPGVPFTVVLYKTLAPLLGMFSSLNKTIVVIILCLGCFGCFAQAKTDAYHLMLKGLLRHTVREITVQQLAIRPENTILLDAREPEEFAISHIKGAVSVGFDHFDPAKWRFLPQNSPIVVYCSVGYRSEKITEQLLAAGYSNVSNLYGGIFEWINEGFAVENESGATNRVHAYSPAWGIWLNKGEKVY